MAQWKRISLKCSRHRRHGFILELKRSPGGENGNPLQYSCLKNTMDRGAWKATVQRVAESQTQLSDYIAAAVAF